VSAVKEFLFRQAKFQELATLIIIGATFIYCENIVSPLNINCALSRNSAAATVTRRVVDIHIETGRHLETSRGKPGVHGGIFNHRRIHERDYEKFRERSQNDL
jgi:hypothetical protein